MRRLPAVQPSFRQVLPRRADGQTYEALFKTCYTSGLPDPVIASCSALISRRLAVGQDPATAFKNRGSAYDEKGDHVLGYRALWGGAARSMRGMPKAFNSRGTTFTALGHPDRAILDFDQAVTLNPGSPLGTATDASPERCLVSSSRD